MAEALFLVTKSAQGTSIANTRMDGIYGMIINKDDGQTNQQIIDDCVAQARVAGHPLRANYFDTVTNISNLTTGVLQDNKDAYVILRNDVQKVEG